MYDRRRVDHQLKVRLLQAKVVRDNAVPVGCATWSLNSGHHNLDVVHSQLVDSVLGGTNGIVRIGTAVSYLTALTLSACEESNETIVDKQRLGFG